MGISSLKYRWILISQDISVSSIWPILYDYVPPIENGERSLMEFIKPADFLSVFNIWMAFRMTPLSQIYANYIRDTARDWDRMSKAKLSVTALWSSSYLWARRAASAECRSSRRARRTRAPPGCCASWPGTTAPATRSRGRAGTATRETTPWCPSLSTKR